MSGPNEVGRGSEGSEAFRGLGPSVYTDLNAFPENLATNERDQSFDRPFKCLR